MDSFVIAEIDPGIAGFVFAFVLLWFATWAISNFLGGGGNRNE